MTFKYLIYLMAIGVWMFPSRATIYNAFYDFTSGEPWVPVGTNPELLETVSTGNCVQGIYGMSCENENAELTLSSNIPSTSGMTIIAHMYVDSYDSTIFTLNATDFPQLIKFSNESTHLNLDSNTQCSLNLYNIDISVDWWDHYTLIQIKTVKEIVNNLVQYEIYVYVNYALRYSLTGSLPSECQTLLSYPEDPYFILTEQMIYKKLEVYFHGSQIDPTIPDENPTDPPISEDENPEGESTTEEDEGDNSSGGGSGSDPIIDTSIEDTTIEDTEEEEGEDDDEEPISGSLGELLKRSQYLGSLTVTTYCDFNETTKKYYSDIVLNEIPDDIDLGIFLRYENENEESIEWNESYITSFPVDGEEDPYPGFFSFRISFTYDELIVLNVINYEDPVNNILMFVIPIYLDFYDPNYETNTILMTFGYVLTVGINMLTSDFESFKTIPLESYMSCNCIVRDDLGSILILYSTESSLMSSSSGSSGSLNLEYSLNEKIYVHHYLESSVLREVYNLEPNQLTLGWDGGEISFSDLEFTNYCEDHSLPECGSDAKLSMPIPIVKEEVYVSVNSYLVSKNSERVLSVSVKEAVQAKNKIALKKTTTQQQSTSITKWIIIAIISVILITSSITVVILLKKCSQKKKQINTTQKQRESETRVPTQV